MLSTRLRFKITAILLILFTAISLSSCQSMKIKTSINRFDDKNTVKRDKAVEELVKIGTPAVNPLIEVLKDKNPKIQSGAAETLGKIKDKSAIKPLTDLLNDRSEEFDVRCKAAAALGEMKDDSSVDPIISFIGEKVTESPTLAFDALLNIGSVSIKPLVNLWVNSSEQVKSGAKATLLKLSDIDVQPFLEIIKDKSEPKSNRIAMIDLLFENKPASLLDTLASVLSDSDPDMRLASIKTIDKLKSSNTVSILVPLLKDSDKNVKLKVIEILSASKDNQALDPLIAALQDNDLEIKKYIMEGLLNFNDNKAADTLCTLVRDKNEEIWKYAVSLLMDADAPFRDKFIASLSSSNLEHLYKNHDYFIDLGIEGSEDALIRALNKYNSPDMAVDFLNCGNKKLDDAARAWAPKHGYRVVNSSGGNAGPRWGSR